MFARIGIFLFLVFASGGLVVAQTPAEQGENTLEDTIDETAIPETNDETSEVIEDDEDDDEAELPDIDVWSLEDEDDDINNEWMDNYAPGSMDGDKVTWMNQQLYHFHSYQKEQSLHLVPIPHHKYKMMPVRYPKNQRLE